MALAKRIRTKRFLRYLRLIFKSPYLHCRNKTKNCGKSFNHKLGVFFASVELILTVCVKLANKIHTLKIWTNADKENPLHFGRRFVCACLQLFEIGVLLTVLRCVSSQVLINFFLNKKIYSFEKHNFCAVICEITFNVLLKYKYTC